MPAPMPAHAPSVPRAEAEALHGGPEVGVRRYEDLYRMMAGRQELM